MPRIVITHDVVDIQRWLKGKHERAAALGAAGRNVTFDCSVVSAATYRHGTPVV